MKLLDFGVAKVDGARSDADETALTATLAGILVGTAAYMSPEQAAGQPADARSDIFSFGAVLYEMLTGERAFQGETQLTTIAAVLRDEPGLERIPAQIAAIVARCLRKSPAERYQTAAQVKAALAAVKPGESRPSVAVLPFANMSADKENEYFSDGLSEEIINALTKVPGLRVIARTSAFRFRGEQDLRKVGEALQVATVLEGSVRRAGSRVRIIAQLIQVSDDSHIWSQRYDRELTDIFAIQDEIAAAIVQQLRVSLVGQAPPKRPSANVVAYELVLEGRYHWYKFTPASAAKALDCVERAVALDPGYAPAHVWLAYYYFQAGGGFGQGEPRLVLPKAKAAAERAVALDPNEPEAQAALAQALLWLDYDSAAAERHWRQALALAPASPFIHAAYGCLHLCPLGRLEDALAQIDLALEQDPLAPLFWSNKALVLFCRRQFQDAAAACQRALDLEPCYVIALNVLAWVRICQRQFSDAFEVIEILKRTSGNSTRAVLALGLAHAVSGNREDAHRVLAELPGLSSTAYVNPSRLASIHSQLRDLDAAFEWTGRAIEQRDPVIHYLIADPLFDPLRSDVRYPALLRKLNL